MADLAPVSGRPWKGINRPGTQYQRAAGVLVWRMNVCLYSASCSAASSTLSTVRMPTSTSCRPSPPRAAPCGVWPLRIRFRPGRSCGKASSNRGERHHVFTNPAADPLPGKGRRGRHRQTIIGRCGEDCLGQRMAGAGLQSGGERQFLILRLLERHDAGSHRFVLGQGARLVEGQPS